jgi:small subunit ribosomal protein S1
MLRRNGSHRQKKRCKQNVLRARTAPLDTHVVILNLICQNKVKSPMVDQSELDPDVQAPTVSTNLETAADAVSDDSFGELLSQFERSQREAPLPGAEGREATVVSVSSDSIFVDIGMKTEGLLPVAALQDKSGELKIKTGDKLRVTVNGRDEEGYYRLSLIHVEQPKDWSGLEAAMAEKKTISGTVTGLIKGGLTVDVGMRAFMPASRSGARDASDLAKLVGQEITCKVIKVDSADNDVVVDRRAVLEEEESKSKEARFGELQEGMVVKGTVRNLLDYGAFIDVGGVDGMLHVAEISYGRVNKPSDVLSVGQQVDVKILKVDPRKKRISLGMKQLLTDPWSTAGEKYHTGERVKGTVSRLTDFGAFVELEPGLDGLIHLSEMSWSKKVRKPADMLKSGDAVEVVILGVNPQDKRVSLGLKQALGDPWEEAEKKYPVGAIAEVPVTSLTKFGAFVQLDEYVEGMIHVGDISADKRLNHPQDELKVGQTVRAVVLELDKGRRRIRLGMKQLVPTAADEYISSHQDGEVVTGRVTDVSRNRVMVELGDGVQGMCALVEKTEAREKEEPREHKPSAQPAVDLNALSSLLSSRWKGGGVADSVAPEPAQNARPQAMRVGQVRSFRITKLDAEKKRIDLELA